MKRSKLLFLFFYTVWFLSSHLVFGQLSTPSKPAKNISSDAASLERQVDSIMQFAIKQKAFPGAQLLVLKNDTVIYQKAYGHHTYDSLQAVSLTDMYDLASVTKILGPLPALMKLVDDGKMNLDVPFSTYWPAWKRHRAKKNLTLRQILSHQAGLMPYIVFVNKAMRKGRIKTRFINEKPNKRFAAKAYEGMYVKNRFRRKMYRTINRSEVSRDKAYRYSGLAFLLFPQIIKNLTGRKYESYLQDEFYGPLLTKTLVYNPRTKNLPNAIIPTEMDTLFRKNMVHGYVHDENAALLGGVSGNAGLFGTADDVGKMMSLYAHYGQFDGRRFISQPIMKEFTSTSFHKEDNRRGLGFDKPLSGNDTLALADAYPSPKASKASFGHSGFTGTFVWADPENQLVFILLTNRVYPYRSQRNLYDLHIRTTLHDIFYAVLD